MNAPANYSSIILSIIGSTKHNSGLDIYENIENMWENPPCTHMVIFQELPFQLLKTTFFLAVLY